MRKSIKNKIAIMLALFGTVSQKTYANNYTGWIVGGVTSLGLGLGIGIGGCYLFGGKSKDENNKVKSREQQDLEESIRDFLDSLPKDDKKLSSYLITNNVSDKQKCACFDISRMVFDNYLNNRVGRECNNKFGYECVSSEQDIKNSKLIIQHFGMKDTLNETDTFILENERTLKIQQNYDKKQYNIVVTRHCQNE